MNMQSALELCINDKAKVRRKNWSKNIFLEYDEVLSDVVMVTRNNRSESTKFTPDIDDILGQWEVRNNIDIETKEIRRYSERLSDAINRLCSKTVCTECPLKFNTERGMSCETMTFVSKLKGVK